MLTKSIRLTEEEAAELRAYIDVSGEVEAVALKKAALRGIRELRLGEAILLYLNERDADHGARVAGLPRAQFLHVLAKQGISVLEEPSSLAADLEGLARSLTRSLVATLARAVVNIRTQRYSATSNTNTANPPSRSIRLVSLAGARPRQSPLPPNWALSS